jgi:hypothetical protein
VQLSEWIDALSHFHQLEVLDDSRLIWEWDSPKKIQRVLQQLVVRCSRLRQIYVFSSSPSDITCEISRHEGARINWVISALDKQGSFSLEQTKTKDR